MLRYLLLIAFAFVMIMARPGGYNPYGGGGGYQPGGYPGGGGQFGGQFGGGQFGGGQFGGGDFGVGSGIQGK